MAIKKLILKKKESWVVIRGIKNTFGEKYAISNQGRLAKFKNKIEEGTLLKGSMQEGYPIWRYRNNGEYAHFLLHRLVAKYFLPKQTGKQTVVIHLNYKKIDNRFNNLKWASIAESTIHQQQSPAVIEARIRKLRNPSLATNSKLTIENVKKIKQLLKNNRSLKEIAKKFGVSDMQIHRIKTGENWGLVK